MAKLCRFASFPRRETEGSTRKTRSIPQVREKATLPNEASRRFSPVMHHQIVY